MIESEGRIMSGMLDYLRYSAFSIGGASVSPAAKKILRDFNDFHKLRENGLMEDIQRMNVMMYSYWDTSVAATGVFDRLIKFVEFNPSIVSWNTRLENDTKYWRDTRVFGDFYILFDRIDGSILVSSNYETVYIVLGLAQSLGEAILGRSPTTKNSLPQFNKGWLGRKILTTLLNWNDKIVYDGLMMHLSVMTSEERDRALKAYYRAVDTNTIIVTLEKKLVVAAESAASTTSTTTAKSGVKIITKTPNPSPIIPSEHNEKVRRIIAHISQASKFVGDMGKCSWIFRRSGYTELTNPQHLVSVLGTGMNLIVAYHRFKALVPDLIEIIELLDLAVTSAGNRKPEFIGIDVEYAVDPIRALIQESTGIKVMYYPPPSAEEETFSNRTNPYLTKKEKSRGINVHNPTEGVHICAVCSAHYSAQDDASPLMKCSRCKNEYYCSKEHQKLHWKVHKKNCMEATNHST